MQSLYDLKRIFSAKELSLIAILHARWQSVSLTWILTLAEMALSAIVPLYIGHAIDGLLDNNVNDFILLGLILVCLVVISVSRGVFDTRLYGTLRVSLAQAQIEKAPNRDVSQLNAQLLMGRELVDFLEKDAPQSLASVISILVTIGILGSYSLEFAYLTGGCLAVTLLLYGLFNSRFFHLNKLLNAQLELQIDILSQKSRPRLWAHFLKLRRHEVRLSDLEALVYGLIFLGLILFIMLLLWMAAQLPEVTAGLLFAVIAYGWDFVEDILVLPMSLQTLSRLSEIRERINKGT